MIDAIESPEQSPSIRATRVPWIIFVVGLAVWPSVWILEAVYNAGAFQSRRFVDVFAYIGAGVGFLCCVVAPFLGHSTLRRKIVFSFLSVAAFAIVCIACALAFLFIFGPPKE